MTTLHKAARTALGALEHCRDVIVERGLNGSEEFAAKWGLKLPLESSAKAINDLRAALAQEPAQPDRHAELKSWSLLAARALDDCHRVIETIVAESSTEEEKLNELDKRVYELFNQALCLHGLMTRTQLDKVTGFGRVEVTGPIDKPAVQKSICTDCSNSDSWGLPDKPVCRGCASGSAWAPLNHDSVNPNKPAQQVVDSDEKAGAYMEARLWEFIDMAAAWPKASPDPRTWNHVMVYAPKPAQQVVTREGLYEAISHGDEKHRTWLKAAIANHFAGLPPPAPDAPQPAVQEPVLYRFRDSESCIRAMPGYVPPKDWTPLYTHPAPQPKRLTNEQIVKIFNDSDDGQEFMELAIAIGRNVEKAVLGEKP